MEKSESMKKSEDEKKDERREFQELLMTLPKDRHMIGRDIYLYQGFWCFPNILQAAFDFQRHFKAHDSDVILATMPKSGTTWLKALAFATLNRAAAAAAAAAALGSSSPLLTANPHDLVPFLEVDLYLKNPKPDLESIPSPRIFCTHMPYNSLPFSLTDHNSKCKIVYLCRNPLDQFISEWHFFSGFRQQTENNDQMTLEQAFDHLCNGISGYGPFWDQVLGYWNASQEMPKRVLFLKYEDMKDDIVSQLKTLARFLGCPFSAEEEGEGAIEEVVKLCSFKNLRDLEVNNTGETINALKNSSFFRKGEVGDWVNYLTPSMAERIKNITDKKFMGSGLSFKFT